MDQTPHLNLPIPNADAVPPTKISDEFPRIAMALVMLDFIIHTLQGVVAGKAEADHTHAISTITGLTEALASKMPANASFSLDSLSDVQGAADALVNYVLVKKPTGQWEPSTALAALGIHNHAISEIVGLTEQLLDILNALDTLAATKAARLSDGASDDTFADASEIGYVDGTTQKRGTFLGLISSIFNGTRALANGIFLSASFAWQNAGGFRRTHNITGHSANRATNWPDGPVTIPAGTLAVAPAKYKSAEIDVVAGGTTTLNHGLGGVPDFVTVTYICKTAEAQFVVGQEVFSGSGGHMTGTSGTRNAITMASATQIVLQQANSASPMHFFTTAGAVSNPTNANFKIIVRAFRWLD